MGKPDDRKRAFTEALLKGVLKGTRAAAPDPQAAYLQRREARIARRLQDEADANRPTETAKRYRLLPTVEEHEKRQREKNSKRGFFGARIGRIDRILRY